VRGRQSLHVVGVGVVLAYFMVNSLLSHTSQVCGPAFTHGNRKGDAVAITFDDGPNEPYTGQILDVLEAYHAKATFFLIGENVLQFPGTVRREVCAGMEIGNHSFNHQMVITESNANLLWQITQTQETIGQVAGVTPAWFRPPRGFRDPRLSVYTKRNDLAVAEWSNMPRDWTCPGTEVIVKRTLDKLKPGDIILLHDGKTVYVGGDRSQTVEALPAILEGIRARGLRCVTLSELASGGGRGLKTFRRLQKDGEVSPSD
jgi:peptidoglycan/xylan/chitin deacetylase (PgdA/CDA1 family)